MTVDLLDTPGHADFSAETERVLFAADYALVVISGPDGVQAHTKTLWQLLERYRIPAFTYAMTPSTRKERNGKHYPEDYRIVCATGARYWGLPNAFGALTSNFCPFCPCLSCLIGVSQLTSKV